jgi:MFS family permease
MWYTTSIYSHLLYQGASNRLKKTTESRSIMSRTDQLQVKTKGHVPVFKSQVLRNRTLLAVSLTVFAAYTGIGMVGPVRVLYAQSRGASLAIIGAMASSYLISNFIFQYPVGWLADRWGRKPMLIAGLLAEAALSAMYLVITDPVTFIALRFLEGIAAAVLLPSARALINDTVPEEQQGEAYGIFGAFFNGGFLLGPGIGGALASLGYSVPFIGAVVFRLVAVVLVVTLIRETRGRSSAGGGKLAGRGIPYRLLFTVPLVATYLIAFGDYLYVGFDLTLMPLWMHDHLGASVAIIGLAYMAWAIPNMIVSPIGGRMADRRRRSTLILIFGLAQVPLYLVYGLTNTWLLVVIGFAIHGVFYSLVQPAVDAQVATSAAPSMRAGVQGLYSTFGLLGAFVGNSGFSPLYEINFRYPMFAIGAAFFVCVLIGGLLVRVGERRKQPVI